MCQPGRVASDSPAPAEAYAAARSRAARPRLGEFEQSLPFLAGLLSVALQSEDTVEGVTAFLEKRDPNWKGR